MARGAIADRAGLQDAKRSSPAALPGWGRAAAIAYAREGADVAINYFPSEERDAQEVIALAPDH
jgi:NAD(P)-dependent dehydrogenase (short-subunit alcohol dehydrogenase family)